MTRDTPALAVVASLLFLAGAAGARAAEPAVRQLQRLQSQLRSSRAANDWHANLASAMQLKALLNEAPRSLLEVARAEIRVGDLQAAVREVEQFTRMGQAADLPALSEDFSALVHTDSFRSLQDTISANRSPVALASPALPLSDAGLLAEDLDYDARSGRFFVTSVRGGRIISVGPDGRSVEFARAPDGWPMLALRVDGVRGVLWATEVALKGFSAVPAAEWGRSALLCYELRSGRLLRRIEAPRPGALGDMVLTGRGDVIVSDGEAGPVYRVRAQRPAMERLDRGDFISPQTPALHPDGRRLFVPDYLRGIAIMDLATGRVRWLSPQGRFALSGIDGLYFAHGKLLAVQNGTTPERIVAFRLDASLTRVLSETLIERSTATLGEPTHGVVVDEQFYYIADSGWDTIDDHGDARPAARPSAPHLMRVGLAGL